MIERILSFFDHTAAFSSCCGRGDRGVRRTLAAAAADRRGAGHHQQPGADQHRGAGALALRDREARDLSDRDGARRHPGPRLHALALAQRLLAGHGRLSRTTSTSISPASRSRERLSAGQGNLPAGAEPTMGAVSTGLGEIYMWTVAVRASRRQGRADRATAKPGWQSDGSYLTPEGRAAARRIRAGDVSAHGAGLDHPPAAEGRARRRRGRCHRRLREAVPRPARSAEAALARPVVRRRHRGAGAQQH